MQNRSLRVAACVLSSALLFSNMNIESFAIEKTGLPSAGIDFFLSSDATSVKSLTQEDTADTAGDAAVDTAADDTSADEANADALADTDESGQKEITEEDTPLSPVEGLEIVAIPKDRVIEETAIASMDKTVPQKERELAAKKEEEGFKSLVIAKVNDYVNVRSIPSEDGDILGKLYDKSVGEFVEEENGWYKIRSGNVTGYVKGEYCVTGEDAVSLAKDVGTRIATVNTTTLYVREEPSTDSSVIGMVPIEDQLLVNEELDG